QEDDRVVVGERDAAAPEPGRGPGDGRRCRLAGERVGLPRLGDIPVLAEPAAQVAPGRAERQHRRARQEMVQRPLLDPGHARAAGAPVGRQHDRVLLAHPHEAEPPLTLVQPAGPRAHIALDPPVTSAMPVPRPDRRTVHAASLPRYPRWMVTARGVIFTGQKPSTSMTAWA